MHLSILNLHQSIIDFFFFSYSYADSFDNYISEEESRFFLPVKEYIAFCDSLRSDDLYSLDC